MREVSTVVKYKGEELKAYFNLNVMEAIQAEYGTLDKWGALTDGKTEGDEVDVKALIFGLREMLNEGIEIHNEETGDNKPLFTHKQVGRILTDMGLERTTAQVNQLVIDSTHSDEADSKNE